MSTLWAPGPANTKGFHLDSRGWTRCVPGTLPHPLPKPQVALTGIVPF